MLNRTFKCECGRVQAYCEPEKSGGITSKEAESIGWKYITGKWVCPFCNSDKQMEKDVY